MEHDPSRGSRVSPSEVLKEIMDAVPARCRENMILIGSLAAGYYYRAQLDEMYVRTKDADALLSPRLSAIDTAVTVTNILMENGWKIRQDDQWGKPGDASTPVDQLPLVRLVPPDGLDWFIELLTVPESRQQRGKKYVRVKTDHGHFALCSFRFFSLLSHLPQSTEYQIRIARPEMMSLANLLEHPEIKPDVISAGFAGETSVKRSNKDLGRVIALARLEQWRDEDALLGWRRLWQDALEDKFEEERVELRRHIGDGLRALLESPEDLDQAHRTCTNGLLASRPPTLDEFRASAARLIQDTIEPLEKS